MKANWLPLSAAVALALGSVTASAVDWHGYARSGINANVNGGDVQCMGQGYVGRLGNECDTFAEIILSEALYNKNNTKFTFNSQLTFSTPVNGSDWQSTDQSSSFAKLDLAMRQMWADYQSADGYSIWAGKRFYQRKDIHIIDYYYLFNDGYGVGIEGIDVGAGNLNFAVTSVNDWSGDNNLVSWDSESKKWVTTGETETLRVYKLDARWNSIPVGFGSLDVAVLYGIPAASKSMEKAGHEGYNNLTRNSGVSVTLDHAYSGGGVSNHFVVQYGTNGLSGDHISGYGWGRTKDARSVQLIDWGVFDYGNFGLGYSLRYQNDAYTGGANDDRHNSWNYGIVFRPEYKWTEYTRTSLELGYDQKKNNPGDVRDADDLYKVTLAQQFTPGKGFWTRPAIRFYVTYLGGDMAESNKHINLKVVFYALKSLS